MTAGVPTAPELSRLVDDLERQIESEGSRVPIALSYESFARDIQARVLTMRKQMNLPRYAPVRDNERIGAAMRRFWSDCAQYVLTEVVRQRDVHYMALARGCLAGAMPLYAQGAGGAAPAVVRAAVLADWQRNMPAEMKPAEYLPIHGTRWFRPVPDATAAGRNGYLDGVLGSLKPPPMARVLPHRADLVLDVVEKAGAAPRSCSLPFVLVPEGRFAASVEGKESVCAVSLPFFMAATETPWAALRCYRDDAGNQEGVKEFFTGQIGRSLPVEGDVPYSQTYTDELPGIAAEFCNWLSAREQLPMLYRRGRGGEWLVNLVKPGYRLPTREEWAFAARYGFDWQTKPGERAWEQMAGSLRGDGRVQFYYKEPRVTGTASGTAYPLGLYDMCGNVEEIATEPAPSAGAVEIEARFVLVGGSAKSRTTAQVMPWAFTSRPDQTHEFVGFRVIRVVPVERFAD